METRTKGQRTCRFLLIIKDEKGKETVYTVRPIASQLHIRAFQVNRGDGTVYHVTQELSGKRSCDCGDFEFRQKTCKHIRSLNVLGLFLKTGELLALQRTARITERPG